MKKPKLFIGSSIEGLTVAYAIQENLTHSAEITVWDQGVFNLSDTTIESLIEVIEKADFGVFIFTPDDIITIRGKKNLAVRDNVLFELGLFIGKIGRKRSFIVMPEKVDFHLPTDLLGITPAKYETGRSDYNFNAATGSLSNKIREAIKKLGFLHESDSHDDTTPLNESTQKENKLDWEVEVFTNKNYTKGIEILTKKLKPLKDIDLVVQCESQICYCKMQIDYVEGKKEFDNLILKYSTNNIAYRIYGIALLDNNNVDDALIIADSGLEVCERKVGLTLLKADCFWSIDQKEQAIEVLESASALNDISIYSQLSTYYSEMGNFESAINAMQKAYKINPRNHELITNFAKIAFDKREFDLALLLYKELILLQPDNSSAWCLLGNSYYQNEAYNLASQAYNKANTLAEEREGWILDNIGNLLDNRGLFSMAEEYLLKSKEIFGKSEYNLNKLADVYKSIEDEEKNIKEIVSRARQKLIENKNLPAVNN